ncbi:MAG: CsbD family protein [Gammaproteobacteria bacterium]
MDSDAVFFLQQIYLVLPQPVPMAKARQRAKVIEDYLRGLLADYEKFIKIEDRMMNWDQVKGNWKQLKGKAQQDGALYKVC